MCKVIDIVTSKAASAESEFERLYVRSRMKEQRLYTDNQVEQLPNIEVSHIHYDEWQIRKRSSARLIRYLVNRKKPLKILEVGCGNGWLSGRLAAVQHFDVTGIDINKTEINQAKKVFREKTNLHFELAELSDPSLNNSYDIIVFAASIQYFSSINKTIADALLRLTQRGEIHILDSFFYQAAELEAARQRSLMYYHSIGCDELSRFYFHHDIHSLNGFSYQFMHDPSSFLNKFSRRKNPLPWIRIKSL